MRAMILAAGRGEREGARVINKPRALRDHPEKLAIMDMQDVEANRLSRHLGMSRREFVRSAAFDA